MRNLKYHSGDSFAFYEKIVASIKKRKEDPGYKDRIDIHSGNIEKLFKDFDKRFKTNSLEKIASYGYDESETSDLNKLYSYKKKAFQELKKEVTKTLGGRSSKICQCCTIGEVNSFDHTLPQIKYAEYSVHPKNLFPSCSRCNGHKNDTASTTKVFLNLYLDILPSKQYLFVDVRIIKKNSIDVNFYLDNPNGIDKKFFKLIESHYDKLHLCDRFPEHIDDVASELVNSIEGGLDEGLSFVQAVRIAETTIKRNKVAFGYNYWPLILQQELLKQPNFKPIFFKRKR